MCRAGWRGQTSCYNERTSSRDPRYVGLKAAEWEAIWAVSLVVLESDMREEAEDEEKRLVAGARWSGRRSVA